MPFKKVRKKASTNNLTVAIINFLRHEGHSASRINVQGQYDEKLGQWRKSGSRKGFYDVCACVLKDGVGRFVVIDIKRGDDKLSGDQIAFKKEAEAAGGIAIEIGNYNHFLSWYRKFMRCQD